MSNGDQPAIQRQNDPPSHGQNLRNQASRRLKEWQSFSAHSTLLTNTASQQHVFGHDDGTPRSLARHGHILRAQAQARLNSWQQSVKDSECTGLPQIVNQLAPNTVQRPEIPAATNEPDAGNYLEIEDSEYDTDSSLSDSEFQIFPAFTFAGSTTYKAWVRLTVSQIHTQLHIQRGHRHMWAKDGTYIGSVPQLLFYKNHPVQFVQVAGVVIAFDEYMDRQWSFTIDDSSGMTIDVFCPKPIAEHTKSTTTFESDKDMQKEEAEIMRLSDTVRENVAIGVVLQIQGTITFFRRHKTRASWAFETQNSDSLPHNLTANRQPETTRQISLYAIKTILTTQQEVELIGERERYQSNVLEKPWRLTARKMARLKEESVELAAAKLRRGQYYTERHRRKRQAEERDAAFILEEYEVDERMRYKAAQQVRDQVAESKERRKSPAPVINTVQVLAESSPIFAQVVPCEPSEQTRSFTSTTTTDSFGITASQKSAMLYAAFGQFANTTRN